MNKSNKIVITGASGFLGSHLLEKLMETESYRVFAFSSQPDKLKEKLGNKNVEYLYKNDIVGKYAEEILNDSVIVNCAYPRNYTGLEIATGLKYIKTVFESAVRNEAKAIINISSQSVYSQQRTEIATENTPICLENSYAVGKYAVELMLDSICRKADTKYTNLRMASLIGPGFNQRIINRLAIKMIQHEQITIVRQEKYMGFLDICDAVEAIMAIIKTPYLTWRPVYNVGNEKGYTVEHIYDVLASILKKKIVIDNPIVETGSEISTTAVSYGQLHDDTGYVPMVDLEESINNILAQLELGNTVL